jgi:hypothetical protein
MSARLWTVLVAIIVATQATVQEAFASKVEVDQHAELPRLEGPSEFQVGR